MAVSLSSPRALTITILSLTLLQPALSQIAVGGFGCTSGAACVADSICIENKCVANCVTSGACPGAATDTRWKQCSGPTDMSCGAGFGCAIAGGGGDFRCVYFFPAGAVCSETPADACDNSKGSFCSSGGQFLRCKFRREMGDKCGADNETCRQGLTCRSSVDGSSIVEDGSGVCGEEVGGRGSACSIAEFKFCKERETSSFAPGRAAEMRTVCENNVCVESDVLGLGDYCGSGAKEGAQCDSCEGLVCSDLPTPSVNEDFARCLRRDPAVTSVGRGCGIPFWAPLLLQTEIQNNDEALACVSKSKKAGESCQLPDYFQRQYVVCAEGLECVNGVCA